MVSSLLSLASFRLAHQYRGGINIGAKISVLVSPPMITVANGRWTSEPMPLEMEAGIRPKIARTRIDNIDLSCSIEVRLMSDAETGWLNAALFSAETNKTPAMTEIPNMETKPTPAETLK